MGPGFSSVKIEKEFGNRVDDGRGLGVAGFRIDVAAHGEPGQHPVEITESGLEAREDGEDGETSRLLGFFEAHLLRNLAKGAGRRPVDLERTVAGNVGTARSKTHPGKRDLHPGRKGRRLGENKPKFFEPLFDVHASSLHDGGTLLMFEIPTVVRNKAEVLGESGWLEALPDVLSALERVWSLQLGAPFPDATEAYVTRVILEDGTPAVLKLLIPRDNDATRHEVAVLERCAGEGCVTLLRSAVPLGALLLERLGPSLHDLGMPVERRHEILCDTARAVWRPATDLDLTTGEEKAQMLAGLIVEWWDQLERPCTRRAVDHALECAERRAAAYDPSRAVLVHGDVHEWNALWAGEGFKLVDPDGLLAEPEYDLGIIMREDPLELLLGDPRDRAAMLAGRTGLDAEAVWEWGVLERVSTGLLGTSVGLQPVATQMLRAAERVAP